ncbi:unnamed protein product [Prorocentrum cordatum]|uniref:Uncharacterized protein n=1 Tax=Prorocentrum cordatum TaxID=2364126 RepID=A0ABN9W3B7_9DINO|nr:unnamed protein product [Polarella glacialis]
MIHVLDEAPGRRPTLPAPVLSALCRRHRAHGPPGGAPALGPAPVADGRVSQQELALLHVAAAAPRARRVLLGGPVRGPRPRRRRVMSELLGSAWPQSSASLPGRAARVPAARVRRIESVERVCWCSEPLNEAGPLRDVLSPRTLPRYLAARRQRGLTGPASWEAGTPSGSSR